VHVDDPAVELLMRQALVAPVALVALVATASSAGANPRALPFTYTTDTIAPGNAELEQYVDLTPLRAISPTTSKEVSYLASALQTELEIGLAERLELGLYVTFVPSFGDQLAGAATFAGVGDGIKQRLRYTINPTPDTVPVIGNAGVYAEVAENERELELELKLLVERRFDLLRIAANLSAEYEFYFSSQRELVLNPSLGATYELSPSLHLGIDSFLRAEYPHPKPAMRTFGLGPQAYAGPAILVLTRKVWWSVGAYARVTSVGHDLAPGEPYGRVWVRSMIGFDL
jgi:hypothetical protein